MTHSIASLSPTPRAPVWSKQIPPPRRAESAAGQESAYALAQGKANCPCGGGCPRCEAAGVASTSDARGQQALYANGTDGGDTTQTTPAPPTSPPAQTTAA